MANLADSHKDNYLSSHTKKMLGILINTIEKSSQSTTTKQKCGILKKINIEY